MSKKTYKNLEVLVSKDLNGSRSSPGFNRVRGSDLLDFILFFDRAAKGIVGYEASFFGRGILHSLGVSIDQEITHNLPVSYRKGIRTTAGGVQSPPLSSWFVSQKPQLVGVSDYPGSEWLNNFICHGYRNMAIHGFVDGEGGTVSVFGIYNYECDGDDRVIRFMDSISSAIHLALQELPRSSVREFHLGRGYERSLLTLREEEVIYWAGQGKTNVEIALILGISSNTVRNHLHNASEKFSASNRMELVSFASHRFVN